MKLKLSQLTIACLYSGVMLLNAPHALAATGTGSSEAPEDKLPVRKYTRLLFSSSRNNDAVRIYPDVLRRTMHVVAKENEGQEIDFFVFDLEGTIIQHYKMKKGDHEKLSGLERGKYIYRVFAGDEETAAGNFEIR